MLDYVSINKTAQPLKNLQKMILRKLSELSAWQNECFNNATRELEQSYAEIRKKGRVDRHTLYRATRSTMRSAASLPDVYAIIFGLTVISWATGAFAEVGYDYGPWKPVVLVLAGALAGIIPFVAIAFLIPLHIVYGVSVWVLTMINVVLSAFLFSLIEPVIPQFFYEGGILYFDDLFWKMLVFYAVSLFFIGLRIHNSICMNSYMKRQNIESIQQYIPADKRGPLIALSAQDHYVKITTLNGECLARLTMKAAISLASDIDGLRVHRSHWVSKAEIVLLEKRAERYILSLRNGAQVPVSKAQVPAIREYLETR